MSGSANSGRRGQRLKPAAAPPASQLAPPPYLSKAAAAVWKVKAPIVAARVDFETVSHFMETYCESSVIHAAALKRLQRNPADKNSHRLWRSSYELIKDTSRHLGLSPLSARHVMAAQKATQAMAKAAGSWRDRLK